MGFWTSAGAMSSRLSKFWLSLICRYLYRPRAYHHQLVLGLGPSSVLALALAHIRLRTFILIFVDGPPATPIGISSTAAVSLWYHPPLLDWLQIYLLQRADLTQVASTSGFS